MFTEQHSLHIKEHKYVLADADLKKDPELVQRVANHIQQHIDLLRTTDPDVLAMMGEQPLGPVGGSPVAPGNVPGMDMNQSAGGAGVPPAPAPPAASPELAGTELPDPATPPPPFENAPTSPEDIGPGGGLA